MTLSNRGPQDSRGNFARDGEFRRKVVDLERPPGRRICGGVGQREVSCAQPSGVCKKVQAWDQEDECAQGGGGDADDLLKDGAGGGEDGPHPGKGQRNRREQVVPRPTVHAVSAPSIDDEGPAERFAEDRRSERDRIATVDHAQWGPVSGDDAGRDGVEDDAGAGVVARSEEHTSELQSRENLVCRLLLEKKNTTLETMCCTFVRIFY